MCIYIYIYIYIYTYVHCLRVSKYGHIEYTVLMTTSVSIFLTPNSNVIVWHLQHISCYLTYSIPSYCIIIYSIQHKWRVVIRLCYCAIFIRLTLFLLSTSCTLHTRVWVSYYFWFYLVSMQESLIELSFFTSFAKKM